MVNKSLSRNFAAVLLTIIGWAVGGAIGAATSGGTIPGAITSPLGWLFGSLMMVLILCWTNTSIRWHQAILAIIGWVMSWPFSFAIGGAVGGFVGMAVVLTSHVPEMGTRAFIIGTVAGLALAGILGGLVTALVLRWAIPSMQETQLLLLIGGWSVAWSIGSIISWIASRNIVSPIGWALSGAVGSSIMFWQLGKVYGTLEDSPTIESG